MRTLFKTLAHRAVRICEHLKGFELPQELPLRTKIAFLTGTYERETSRFIEAHVRGGVALDIGAHVGYYSRLLARRADSIYAFEPDPINYALLVKNTKKFANVVPVNKAVSDIAGAQPFFRVPHSTFRHSLIDEGGSEKIVVEAIALDAFSDLAEKKVSFVKIDVEGHEEAVLSGMRKIIERDRPLVIAEMPLNDRFTAVSPTIGGKRKVRNYIVV